MAIYQYLTPQKQLTYLSPYGKIHGKGVSQGGGGNPLTAATHVSRASMWFSVEQYSANVLFSLLVFFVWLLEDITSRDNAPEHTTVGGPIK